MLLSDRAMLQGRAETQQPCKRKNKRIYNSSPLPGMLLEKKIQVLVPVARTAAMTASCKFHRRALSVNALQELMLLQKEGIKPKMLSGHN